MAAPSVPADMDFPPDFDPLPLLVSWRSWSPCSCPRTGQTAASSSDLTRAQKLLPKPCDRIDCGPIFAPLLLALMINSAAIVIVFAQAGTLLYRREGRALSSLRSMPHVGTAIVVVCLLHLAICIAELSQTVKVRRSSRAH